MTFKKTSCLTCKHWDLDICTLAKEFKTLQDVCSEHKEDTKFSWAIVYDSLFTDNQVFDLYTNKKYALQEVDYVKILGYTNIRIINLKELTDNE